MFNAYEKVPGVYIDEIEVQGPIPGVSTSIAAFIGPALKGPINTPVRLMNWTQFNNVFGGFSLSPMVYVTHGVKGFFENKGASCQFIRVGNVGVAYHDLMDRKTVNSTPTLKVTAKEEGEKGNLVHIKVSGSNIVSTKALRKSKKVVSITDKNVLNVGDGDEKVFALNEAVMVEQEGFEPEEAVIEMLDKGKVTLKGELTTKFDDTKVIFVRSADLKEKDQVYLEDVKGIETGTYLKITQDTKNITCVVKDVDEVSSCVLLESTIDENFSMADGAKEITVASLEFSLTVKVGDYGIEYENLSIDPRHTRYFKKVVNSDFIEIDHEQPPNTSVPPENLPADYDGLLAGGAKYDVNAITKKDYLDAIDTLKKVDDVNILCIPDCTQLKYDDMVEVQLKMIEHCKKMQDRFAVLDAKADTKDYNVYTHREALSSKEGYGAFYYPWIVVGNPIGPGKMSVPPSGYVAGVYARTDDKRGIHKAPANEEIYGALAVLNDLAEDEMGPLNEKSINVIRNFTGRGIKIWGARTLAPQASTQWRYINVRRLMLYIEESVKKATEFAVFEPNNMSLWATVKRQVSEFLTGVWRSGALFGATAAQAFSVKVDEELNPPSVRALGQLIIEVKVYPVTPAEFIVFRVIQQPGGPSVQE